MRWLLFAQGDAVGWPFAVMVSVAAVCLAAVTWKFLWLMAQPPPDRPTAPPREPLWESETTEWRPADPRDKAEPGQEEEKTR